MWLVRRAASRKRQDGTILRHHCVDQVQTTHHLPQIVEDAPRDDDDDHTVSPGLGDGLSYSGIKHAVLGDRAIIVERQYTEPHVVCLPGSWPPNVGTSRV